MSIARNIILAAIVLYPMAADATAVLAVRTGCKESNSFSGRPLPGEAEIAAGETYAPLSASEIDATKSAVGLVFGEVPSSTSEIAVAYPYGTPLGNPSLPVGIWPVSAVRAHVQRCTIPSVHSMGRVGGVTYALAVVECASTDEVWTLMLLGVEMQNSKVTSTCLNVGRLDYAELPPVSVEKDAK